MAIFLLLLSFSIFFSTKHSSTFAYQRAKRQINFNNVSNDDRQHYTNKLRQIFLYGTSSSVLSDCTLNIAYDGIYRIPSENTLSSQVIRLVEDFFESELRDIQRLAMKIRSKFNQRMNYFTESSLGQFRDEFSLDLRLLLASQVRIQEVHLIIASNDNGISSYRLKYSRLNQSLVDVIDFDKIHEESFSNQWILQTFTISNARDTLNDDQQQRLLFTNGWWLGPVLCEKNPEETELMAHVFPLLNR